MARSWVTSSYSSPKLGEEGKEWQEGKRLGATAEDKANKQGIRVESHY